MKIQTLERPDSGIISMFGNSCPDCMALFVEMRSAIMEANAIIENTKALRRASNRQWWEIRESWENARRRWREASTEFKNHAATHHSPPSSAKRVAKV